MFDLNISITFEPFVEFGLNDLYELFLNVFRPAVFNWDRHKHPIGVKFKNFGAVVDRHRHHFLDDALTCGRDALCLVEVIERTKLPPDVTIGSGVDEDLLRVLLGVLDRSQPCHALLLEVLHGGLGTEPHLSQSLHHWLVDEQLVALGLDVDRLGNGRVQRLHVGADHIRFHHPLGQRVRISTTVVTLGFGER